MLLLNAGCARHYRADGMVVRVNPARPSLVISHRDIKGLMPAMTMEFAAGRQEKLAGLVPGTRIAFQLSVTKHGSQVSGIRKLTSAIDYPNAQPLRPEIGTVLADFQLIDQQNKPVSLSSFRGQVVVVDFIYTRCPLPDVCPRLSANFRRLQRRFGTLVTLLSITIDPRFDTAEVLDRYAKLWSADPVSWHFLTGTPAEIETVAKSFGLLYFPEEGSMTHSTQTAVISRSGKLAGIVEGPGYAVSQLGDLVAAELEMK